MRERHVPLEERRPTAAGRIADLPMSTALVNRDAHPPRLSREPRRQADVGVELLQRIPIDAQSRELPRRTPLPLGGERRLPVVAFLVGGDGPAEAELER